MKHIIKALTLLLSIFYTIELNSIIIRHDIEEKQFIELAKNLPVIDAIVKYNETDVAGTLITDQWVLSAAHVAETIKNDHKLIVAGDSVGIHQIFIHPEWEEEDRPDLALIKLNQPLKHVKPVPLYTEMNEVGQEVIIAGIGDFGNGLTGIQGKPGTMRAATNLVDGVTEYYTRVSKYSNWIEETISDHSVENLFDFWVGEWEVSWISNDSTRIVGTNTVLKILDGKVIQENFNDPSRNFKGTSISVLNTADNAWHQAWAYNQGGYYEFVGERQGEDRIFKTKNEDERGATYRMIFTDIKPDSFTWKWQGIKEGLDDWKTVWEIDYVRIQ
ncbi:trypsin-like serine protease [Portibacter marinus]|uniref:trypsin-like serine protease n=1 Tax=Portibacter marinus TaxID=2898660 RepID=UPI001F3ACCF9|nr:trypsin-like serine protease [Portibacter marinus]